MKLKRNTIPKLIGIALLILLCLTFLIPDLSLRARVFIVSPKSAFTMEYVEDKEAWELADEPKDNIKIYRITKNIPHDEDTDTDMVLWRVRSYGPFHVAAYHGGTIAGWEPMLFCKAGDLPTNQSASPRISEPFVHVLRTERMNT